MDSLAKFIEAMASLLWPIIVLFVMIRFGPAVRQVLESARSRKFTVKVGGQELTMEEANEQQRTLITDLQAQFARLEQGSPGVAGVAGLQAMQPTGTPERSRTVLWVDDNPRNNAYLAQSFRERGIEVDLALSTSEAMERLHSRRYGAVISDVGREENGKFQPDAGLHLLEEVRRHDPNLPFIFYSSAQRARDLRKRALDLGATRVTSSPTDVSSAILMELGPTDA